MRADRQRRPQQLLDIGRPQVLIATHFSSLSSDCAQDAIGENDTIFDETCYPVSSRPAGVSVDTYIRQYMAENWLTTATDGNHKCTAAELRMAGK